jgi:hypothetical protein
MKFSSDTLSILKNFATINSGIEFKTGKTIATISTTKTILAKASIADDIPGDFCVDDLNSLLSVLSMYDDIQWEFEELNVIIKSAKSKTKFRKAFKKDLVLPPEKELNFPSSDGSFTLSENDLVDILKSSAVIDSKQIIFESDGKTIFATNCTLDENNNPTSHSNSIELGKGNGKVFKAVFLRDNFKMMSGEYAVELSSKGLASFKNTKINIQYWIAIEVKQSSFGG